MGDYNIDNYLEFGAKPENIRLIHNNLGSGWLSSTSSNLGILFGRIYIAKGEVGDIVNENHVRMIDGISKMFSSAAEGAEYILSNGPLEFNYDTVKNIVNISRVSPLAKNDNNAKQIIQLNEHYQKLFSSVKNNEIIDPEFAFFQHDVFLAYGHKVNAGIDLNRL